MSLDAYKTDNDWFEYDESNSDLSFPCCVCLFKNGSQTDQPCRTCGHNANSKEVCCETDRS